MTQRRESAFSNKLNGGRETGSSLISARPSRLQPVPARQLSEPRLVLRWNGDDDDDDNDEFQTDEL